MLPSEKNEKKEESVFKIKSWTVIVCCTILIYVQNYACIVMIYLAKLVKIYCFSLLPVVIDLVNRDYENSAVWGRP